jgi:hypothetical protein
MHTHTHTHTHKLHYYCKDKMIFLYNLLFKSCRFAPLHLEKTRETTVDPPHTHTHTQSLHYYCKDTIFFLASDIGN